MKHKAIIIIFFILTLYNYIYSDTFPVRYSGNKLVEDMNEYMKSVRGEISDMGKVNFFMGYVTGIADGYGGLLFRIPFDGFSTQFFEVVVNYVYKNPMRWSSVSAEVLVREALQKAFPLNK